MMSQGLAPGSNADTWRFHEKSRKRQQAEVYIKISMRTGKGLLWSIYWML